MADLTAPTSTATTPTTAAPTASAPAKSGSRKTALADAFRTHFSGDAPLTDKARGFAKARPWTSAAFVGLAGLAVLNTLRGRAGR